MADGRRRRETVSGVDLHRHVVCCEDLECCEPSWFAECVGIAAEKDRASRALRCSVLDDRLRGCGDVRVVE